MSVQVNKPYLIDNVYILSPQVGGAPDISDGPAAILISGNRIEAIVNNPPEIESIRANSATVFDGHGKIAMPGLINGHCHTYGTLLRGTENSQPLEVWALFTMAYGKCLDSDLIQSAVALSAAEMIRNGITSVVDHIPHIGFVDEMVLAHAKTGMRVGVAPFMQNIPDHEFLQFDLSDELRAPLENPEPMSPADVRSFFDEFFARMNDFPDRLIAMIGPNAPQRCSPELWQLWRHLQENYRAPVHTHLLETEIQAIFSWNTWEGGLVAEMARQDLLNDRLSVAHGIWLQESERELLHRHGVTVIHNPASNLMLGSGLMPLERYRQLGVPVGLGSDSANTGGRHDIFAAARLAAMLPRLGEPDYLAWPATSDVLFNSIRSGARALGHGGELGELAVGYLADLILLDQEDLCFASLRLNAELIAQHANSAQVCDVMINGEWVLRDGCFLSIDEDQLCTDFKAQSAAFQARAQVELGLARKIEPAVRQALYRER